MVTVNISADAELDLKTIERYSDEEISFYKLKYGSLTTENIEKLLNNKKYFRPIQIFALLSEWQYSETRDLDYYKNSKKVLLNDSTFIDRQDCWWLVNDDKDKIFDWIENFTSIYIEFHDNDELITLFYYLLNKYE